MAVRYRQQLLNISNVYFQIEILDTDYVGSVLDFHLKDFEIDWKGQQSERDNFILGSECVVIAQSTNSFDLNPLMDDLRESEEGRFQIAIYKKETLGGTYELHWLGLVLNDLSGGEDSAPIQQFEIVATDGLGILKGIDYKVDDTTPYGDLTAVQHLMNCLKKIPYNSFFGNSDLFLYTMVHVYESAMANSTDSVLSRIQVPGGTFYYKDKNGIYDFKNCYEVLELLTVLFKSRLYLQNGFWRFYELYSLENVSNGVYKVFQYDETEGTGGTIPLRATITGGFDGGNRLAGQRFEWLAALKEVKQTYLHFSSDNLMRGDSVSVSGPAVTVVNSLKQTGTETLLLSCNLNTNIVENPLVGSNRNVYVKFRMMFYNNPYYYVRTVINANQNNDYSLGTWQTVPGYVEFIVVQYVNYSGNNILPISFETPPIPSNTSLRMDLEIVSIEDLQQNDISAAYNITAHLDNAYLEYIDGEAENERIYKSVNNTSGFYSSIVEFPAALCGDRINEMTPNNLKVWNGTAWVESTGTWKRNGLNGTTTLLQLTLNEFLGGQRKFVKKRQGQFVGRFNPLLAIGFGGEYYLPLGVRFSANNASYDGDRYKIGEFNDSGLTTTFNAVGLLDGVPPSVLNSPVINNTNATGVSIVNGGISIEDLVGRAVAIQLKAGVHNYMVDSLGIGSSNKYDSAIFSIDSTERGFLLPRMTEAQRDDITAPTAGLLVYQTDEAVGVYVYGGSGWDRL